ncbi:hypothetical protein BD289DRAFT_16638 [Coniella lustricola]|uniref:Secreted protein n=1 Tax=Coniella lustricola TaxID=2025994 RepID=A0A2T3A3U4_9PEZI|nr:hypothetical protein BD289DRAFT_16638 [Coniella lustricola]
MLFFCYVFLVRSAMLGKARGSSTSTCGIRLSHPLWATARDVVPVYTEHCPSGRRDKYILIPPRHALSSSLSSFFFFYYLESVPPFIHLETSAFGLSTLSFYSNQYLTLSTSIRLGSNAPWYYHLPYHLLLHIGPLHFYPTLDAIRLNQHWSHSPRRS